MCSTCAADSVFDHLTDDRSASALPVRGRYLDCEWDLPRGENVVLEVDGQHHLRVEHWQADMRRERGVVISGRRVLRATATEVRAEAHAVASDLVAIGVPRVVRR